MKRILPLFLAIMSTSCVVSTETTTGPQGAPGAVGAEGLSCWDANGDGIEDPGEDRNDDGVWNAQDCAGASQWAQVESGIHYSDGHVGIGTDDPAFPLHVQGTGAAVAIESHSDDGLTCPAISFRRRRGTPDSPGMVADGDLLGALYFNGYDDDSSFPSASMTAEVDGATGPSVVPSRLTFLTRSGAAADPAPIERMRITSRGDVGIGTMEPMAVLDVNGTARLKKYPAAPVACEMKRDGAIALTSKYTLCVCHGDIGEWRNTADPEMPGCQW